MRWLITGGAGFIGRALISKLLKNDQNIIKIFDNLSVASRIDLDDLEISVSESTNKTAGVWENRVELIVNDILNRPALLKETSGADIMVHLAANTGVAPSVADPTYDCKTNVIGTLNALESCRENNVSRFVFASSGAPLGQQTPPLHEDLAPHPASPYGASKLAGEGYCSAYFHSYGVETVCLRFGNVYGPGSENKSSVISKYIRRTLEDLPLEIYGDGQQTRDFIFISDLVEAIIAAAVKDKVGGEIFQIATSKESSLVELVKKLSEIMKSEGLVVPEIEHTPERVGDVKRNYSQTLKAKKKLEWEARVELNDGLRQTVHYFLSKLKTAG